MEPTTDIKAARHVWNIFQRIRNALQEIEKFGETVSHLADLEKRVAELEKRLERCPGEGCPKSGALAFRVARSSVGGTPIWRDMECGECGFAEEWPFRPNL